MASEYTETSRAHWEGVAQEWGRRADELEDGPAGDASGWILDAVALQPGETVLELACGAAELGLRAARTVGPDGRVVLSDFSAAMVTEAQRRAEAAGLNQVETRVIDASRIDLPGAAFDAVLCRFGYMLMEDPAAAMAETARVLRPGGRVGLAVWDDLGLNPWVLTLMQAVMEHLNAPAPEPDTPAMDRLADPERLRALLEGAGLADVRVERVESSERHDSPGAWWERMSRMAGPLKALFAAVPEGDLRAIRERAETNVLPYTGDDGSLDFPASIRVAAARRP